jgi:hypothetical protein
MPSQARMRARDAPSGAAIFKREFCPCIHAHNIVTKTDKFCRTRCKSGGAVRHARTKRIRLSQASNIQQPCRNSNLHNYTARALRDRDAIRNAREKKENIIEEEEETRRGIFRNSRGTIALLYAILQQFPAFID